ncbi:hypothetical protein [Bacillus sp. MMSF_3328]|uniref:hypothetical protein n=1 Tax=Bacillus sp. MMSF_3328 TaxID=3047080 RepID=UPI00273FEA03|nr:hypothetical protein [Bacillus sp. MMSF_3328]
MTAKELQNSVWSLNDDLMKVTKVKGGYYGIGNKFDFERKTAKETISQLKKWGYVHIGYEN